MGELARELWKFLKKRKKFLALAHIHNPGIVRGPDHPDAGLSRSAFHLHALLEPH